MKLKQVLLGVLIMFLIILAACSREPQQKPKPPERIGVSISIADAEWEKLLQETAKQQAKEDKIQLEWQNAKGDPQQQSQQLDKMLEKDLKALIVQFADPVTAPSIVQQFISQGIKVVVMGELPENTPADGFVGVDFKRLGEMQAQYLLGLKEQGVFQGETALLLPDQPSGGIMQVAETCKALLAENGEELIQRRLPLSELSSFLEETSPGSIVVEDPQMLTAVLQELQLRQLAQQVVTVGLGGGKQAAQAIVAGLHEAEADPVLEAVMQQSYRAAVDLVKEGSWDYELQLSNGAYDIRTQLVPVRLITRDNVYLLEQRWGKLGPPKLEGQQQQGQQQSSDSEGGSSGSSEEGSSQSGQQGGQQQKGQKVLIKTKDGQTMEIQVPGQIEQVTIEGEQDDRGQAQGQEGGGE